VDRSRRGSDAGLAAATTILERVAGAGRSGLAAAEVIDAMQKIAAGKKVDTLNLLGCRA
jgi:hypothetical protein